LFEHTSLFNSKEFIFSEENEKPQLEESSSLEIIKPLRSKTNGNITPKPIGQMMMGDPMFLTHESLKNKLRLPVPQDKSPNMHLPPKIPSSPCPEEDKKTAPKPQEEEKKEVDESKLLDPDDFVMSNTSLSIHNHS